MNLEGDRKKGLNFIESFDVYLGVKITILNELRVCTHAFNPMERAKMTCALYHLKSARKHLQAILNEETPLE